MMHPTPNSDAWKMAMTTAKIRYHRNHCQHLLILCMSTDSSLDISICSATHLCGHEHGRKPHSNTRFIDGGTATLTFTTSVGGAVGVIVGMTVGGIVTTATVGTTAARVGSVVGVLVGHFVGRIVGVTVTCCTNKHNGYL